jgi:hypothetical protein
LIRDHFRPLGVVIGSEKQGGQHQGSNTAVTWPVAFIVTISIDGRNENLCNYWRTIDISSGSELGFNIQMKNCSTYSLNYSKQLVTKSFGVSGHDSSRGMYPQICPCKNHDVVEDPANTRMPKLGYWHICMSQMMHQKVAKLDSSNNAASFHSGAVLQSTISITWVNRMWNHDLRKRFEDHKKKSMKTYSNRYKGPRVAVMASQKVNVTPQYLTTAGNPRAVALNTRVDLMKQDRNIAPHGVVRKAIPLTDSELQERGFSARFKMQRVSFDHSIASNPQINTDIVITTEAKGETTLDEVPVIKRGKTQSKKKESSITTAADNNITRL